MKTHQKLTRLFLPDFCQPRLLFMVVVLGELLAIILTLATAQHGQALLTSLAYHSLFIQWVALPCAGLLCLTRNHINRLPIVWSTGLSYLLTVLVALVVTELAWRIFQVRLSADSLSQGRGAFVLRCMGISAVVSALWLRYFYMQHQWRENLESEVNARMQALQSRIRPHFFFNCMNTIASLTQKSPALAEEATEDLADLFRVCLQEVGRFSTLGEEIALCQRYIRIETHRFGERLKVVWETDDLPSTMTLPLLTLQPLIENAIYHGIESLPAGGVIFVRGTLSANCATIMIDNPLAADIGTKNRRGNQIALDNLRERLSAHYDDCAELVTFRDKQRYITKIIVPHPS